MPTPFVVLLVFWISLIFVSFGLFAPRNATVVVVLFVCALSIATSIFLVEELGRPFEGIMKISSGPVRYASRISISRLDSPGWGTVDGVGACSARSSGLR